MRPVGLAVAACVVAALAAGCNAGVMSSASATGVSPAAAPDTISERPAKFGERRTVSRGSLTVTVLAPKSFVPGNTAYPQSPRAVAFEVVLDNQGSRTYRPAQLVVKATGPAGNAVDPVVDKTQGYAGGVNADAEVPPGKNIRVTFAFAVPADPIDLTVTVQPDIAAAADRAEFEGTS
ncbi:hypothetical protein ALI144C_21270 [Actinosynnema sp. ALI-1.44]|nr:hypothetical protein ALI144C_21270 [Actinosynnema sp. ALI-1.44]